MRDLIAHSENPERCVPVQPYRTHCDGIESKLALQFERMQMHLVKDVFDTCQKVCFQVAPVHDMGKLCDLCQQVLYASEFIGKMPNHVDAGVNYLLQKSDHLSAWVSHAHHLGLDDLDARSYQMRDAKVIGERCGWVPLSYRSKRMQDYTDQIWNLLVHRQHVATDVGIRFDPNCVVSPKIISSLTARLTLGSFVQADHADTAEHYKSIMPYYEDDLRAKERLIKLTKVVKDLQKKARTENKSISRANSRKLVFDTCMKTRVVAPLVYCDAEVGTGKTLAALAYALRMAKKFGLRRIIYVAPFTNVIHQTVKVIRNAVVLSGESKYVVAEHHHQVDYDDIKNNEEDEDKVDWRVKQSVTHWAYPIICTTAVQFFETLASNRPGKLKKLPSLPGSMIIVDECHLSMPLHLWPVSMRWIKELAENWNCRFLFMSGSMTKPWNIPLIRDAAGVTLDVKPLMPAKVARSTGRKEKQRIRINHEMLDKPFDLKSVCEWVQRPEFSGPKLMICNTIQNAAIIAYRLRCLRDKNYVMHMSTALAPVDREQIIEAAKNRLDRDRDRTDDWIMVATSCVDCGMDFSFRHGFREASSLMSSLQIAGRVRRDHEDWKGELHLFELEDEFNFTENTEFAGGIKILKDFIRSRKSLSKNWCERALELESDAANKNLMEELVRLDRFKKMRSLAEKFHVINEQKFTALVNPEILDDPSARFDDIVRNSVQIYYDKLDKSPVSKVNLEPEHHLNRLSNKSRLKTMYVWDGRYESFQEAGTSALGYKAHELLRAIR